MNTSMLISKRLRTFVAFAGVLAFTGLAAPAFAGDDKGKDKKELKAKIEVMPAEGRLGEWTIGGWKVLVTDKTELDEDDGMKFAAGQMVEVEGYVKDGVIHAKEIETED